MAQSRSNDSTSTSDTIGLSPSQPPDHDPTEVRVRLDGLEKRVSDASTYVGWAFGSVAILLSAITIVSGLKYSSEIDRLNDFKKEVESRLEEKVNSYIGNLNDRSHLVLLPINSESFDGRPIPASLDTDAPGFSIILQIRNIGDTSANITFLKMYTTDEVPLQERYSGSDIPGFSYSKAYPLKDIHIRNLPPTASAQYRFGSRFRDHFDYEQLLGKESKIMLSVYYGVDSKHQKEVKIHFEEQ